MIEVCVSGCFRNYETNYGYGRAADEILKGFTERNIGWAVDDATKDIEIFWGHPPYEFQRSNHYKIGYTAWESTGFKDGWHEDFKDADEIWTPSDWLSKHFAETTGLPTFTFPHGVESKFKPFRHYKPDKERPFTFYHIGEPQFRKNGQMVVDAFVELFGNNPDFRLVLKATRINTTRIYSGEPSQSIMGSPNAIYNNITIIDGMLSDEQLIELQNKVDCLVYPSIGEGFGFHPIEALAAGLPTICTSNWAMYDKYITIPIEGVLSESPWQDLHPGNAFNVTKEQVKEAMIDMVENYEKYAGKTFKNSFYIHDEYKWSNQISKAVKRLEDIASSRINKK
jgi:glycosyltransferase involved in cell wall biosynthesis